MMDQQDDRGTGGGGGPLIAKTSPCESGTTSGGHRRRGAQPGNKLALKTGRYCKTARDFDARVRAWTGRNDSLIAFAHGVIAEYEKAKRRKRPRGPRKWVSPRP